MSTSVPVPIDVPIDQPHKLSHRILAMANLIIHYKRLLDETIIPAANDIIAIGDTAQFGAESILHKSDNRMKAIETSGIKMGGRRRADLLLKSLNAHVDEFWKYGWDALNFYVDGQGYLNLKEDVEPDVFTVHEDELAAAVRDSGADYYAQLKEALLTQADDDQERVNKMLEENQIWNEFMKTDKHKGFGAEFSERMAEWNDKSNDLEKRAPSPTLKLSGDIDDHLARVKKAIADIELMKAAVKTELEKTVDKSELEKDSTD